MTECEQVRQITLQNNISDYGYVSKDGVVDWVEGITIHEAFKRPYPRDQKRAVLHSMEELKCFVIAPSTPVVELAAYRIEGLI